MTQEPKRYFCKCGLEKVMVSERWKCRPCAAANKRAEVEARKIETPEQRDVRMTNHRAAALATSARSDNAMARRHKTLVKQAAKIKEKSLAEYPVRRKIQKPKTIVQVYMAWERRWKEPVKGLDHASQAHARA